MPTASLPIPVASMMGLIDGTTYYQSANSQPDFGYNTTIKADQTISFHMVLSNAGSPIAVPATYRLTDNGTSPVLGTGSLSNVSASNRIPNSNNLSGWQFDTFNSTQVVVTPNAVLGPDGGSINSATKLVWNGPWTGASAYADIEYQSADGQKYGGQSHAFSFWGRVDTGTSAQIVVYMSDWPFTGLNGGIITFTLTPTWQRYELTGFFPVGSNSFRPILRYFGPTAQTAYIWGVQMELLSGTPHPGPLIPTSGAALAGQGAYGLCSGLRSGGAGTHSWVGSLSSTGGTVYSTPPSVFTVVQAQPTLTVTASPNAVVGISTTISVAITTCYQPTGKVTLTNGLGVVVKTVTPTITGNATATAAFLVPNTRTGAANYTISLAADTNNIAASKGLNYSVSIATPTLTLSSLASVVVGSSVTYAAHLGGAFTPTGTISFYKNGTTLIGSPVTVSAFGIASLTVVDADPPGSYAITAVYSGDANNAGLTSAAQSLTVTLFVPTVVLAASVPNPSIAGLTFTVQAFLSVSDNATGSVAFSYGPTPGSTPLATINLAPGAVGGMSSNLPQAVLSTTLAFGSYTLWVVYSGDTNNQSVTSSETLTVAPQNVTLTVTASPTTLIVANPVTLTATVTEAGSGGGTSTTTELMVNGNFETGSLSGWNPARGDSTGSVQVSTAQTHSGTYAGLVTGTPPPLHVGGTSQSMYQIIAIPSTATAATLTLWYWAASASSDPTNAFQALALEDTSNPSVVVPLLVGPSNTQTWTLVTQDLTAYIGKTLLLAVGVTYSNLATGPISLYVDDVSLQCVTPGGA
jgi:hypothetical protein